MTPEQATELGKTLIEWAKQQSLPEEQRDVLELQVHNDAEWGEVEFPAIRRRWRLVPRKEKRMVYVYLEKDGSLTASLEPKPDKSCLTTTIVEISGPKPDWQWPEGEEFERYYAMSKTKDGDMLAYFVASSSPLNWIFTTNVPLIPGDWQKSLRFNPNYKGLQ